MADYNSPNTGSEIDAAIAKTDKILESVQVYSGSPTKDGVPMSSIPVNPTTGDKTGVYDIIYSSTTTSVDASDGQPGLSRVWIGNEAQTSNGSGFSDMSNTDIYLSSGDYDGTKFTCEANQHAFGSGTSISLDVWIHKIFRLQEVS